ncbi:hypothetical protein NL108_017237, partial [Boleophthalmus pectinirostris]
MEQSWSDAVAVGMQSWVDGCVLAHGKPSTRLLDGYELGENLFYASSPRNWSDVITAWHNEVRNFKYPHMSTNGRETGHYTQVVWNSSYKVGCAMAKCTNRPSPIYFYGCRYYRAYVQKHFTDPECVYVIADLTWFCFHRGNFKTWHPYTAGKACGMCPNNCVNKLCTNPCPYINRFLNCRALKSVIGSCNDFVTKNCPALCKCPTEII